MTHNTTNPAIANSTAAVEAAHSLATVYLANIELLLELNLNTAREAAEAFTEVSKTMASATSPVELQSVASSLGQPLLEKSLSYSRRAYEIFSQTNQEMSKLIIGQISNPQLASGVPESWTALVNGFAKNVQQFSSTAAQNVKAVSEAGVKAGNELAARAKKAA
jgi:phasin family protein